MSPGRGRGVSGDSTGGGCAVGSTDKVTPPDDPEIAKLEAAAGGDDPFARR